MSLRDTTVANIVDATRSPNAPVVHVVGEAEQRATLESFQKELGIEGVGSYFSSSEPRNELIVDVDINVSHLLPETDWEYNWYNHFLELLFVDDTLQMKCGDDVTMRLVADVPHVVRIVETITTRLQEQWKRKQKRMKVHDLRVRAIELQAVALATRLDLSCLFDRSRRQLWISIFDSPIEAGVGACISLDKPPHDHIAKLEKDAEEFHQRQQKQQNRQQHEKYINKATRGRL